MKKVLGIICLLVILPAKGMSQNYFLRQTPGDASCFSYTITDVNNKPVNLPANIKQYLACPSVIALNGNVLIIYADDKLQWHNIATGVTTVLVTLYNDIDGVSNPVWSPNGKQLMFTIINQERKHGYKESVRIMVLGVDEKGQVTSKKKYDRPVHFSCGSICTSSPDEDFKFKDDNTIQYRRHELLEDHPGEWESIILK